jgi:recombination protein RecT|tara:strand:- start:795 stop:1862 length:1068 start_codon:yes stop_codon:yes gene_type:complete
MSAITQEPALNEIITSVQAPFQAYDLANGKILDFKQECLFAKQQITKGDGYALKVVQGNPASLKNSLLNTAAIGISLNPALAHAYLVPRGGAICLDISYRGLVYLATQCGAILWAKAELVYSNDEFTWNGIMEAPHHKADPFSDRGEVTGGYCLAKLPDGSIMTDVMSREELDKIKQTSKAKDGPWKNWETEMQKKSLVKRASKSFPQTGDRKRIDTAIEVLNEHEGFVEHVVPEATFSVEQEAEYKKCIEEGDFFNLAGVITAMDADDQLKLFTLHAPVGEKGKKMAVKKEFSESLEDGRMRLEDAVNNIREFLDDGNESDIEEIVSESSPFTVEHIMNNLSVEHKAALVRFGV